MIERNKAGKSSEARHIPNEVSRPSLAGGG